MTGVVISLSCSLIAATAAPKRGVENNVIISERDPKVRIELPKSVQYVGADRWVLLGIADCELHAFVEADAQKNVGATLLGAIRSLSPVKTKTASSLRFAAARDDRRPGLLCRYLDKHER